MITPTRWWIDRVAERGAALVELALVLPLLVLVMVGASDFARVFYYANVLTNAARAGAQFGAASSFSYLDTAGMEGLAQSVADANIPVPHAVIGSSITCKCYSDAGVLGAAASPACTGTCPTAGQHVVIHVTVTATRTFTMIAQHVPGIPASLALTRSATLRAQ